VAGLSIRDQIRKLVDLQKLDKEIYEYKKELEEKPASLADVKEKFESKKAKLRQLEEQLKAIQVGRKSQELELQSKETEISKHNVQLSQLKTNREYTAKLTEIESLKADKSIIEEKILGSYDESDKVSGQIAEEKKLLEGEEGKYIAEQKATEEAMRLLEDKVKILETQRQQITPDVDKSFLAQYERILAKKSGLAIVPVQGSVCGGCFMNVTQQVINEIKMHDKIIVCEMCARILYIEEDL